MKLINLKCVAIFMAVCKHITTSKFPVGPLIPESGLDRSRDSMEELNDCDFFKWLDNGHTCPFVGENPCVGVRREPHDFSLGASSAICKIQTKIC
jgi:hypothetical protein